MRINPTFNFFIIMYIYNVTINVDETIHFEWLAWMKQQHIPAVLSTGKFTKALMSQVLVKEDMGGVTYSIQFTCETKETLFDYYQKDAPQLRKSLFEKYGNKFGAFRTEMKVIQEFFPTK